MPSRTQQVDAERCRFSLEALPKAGRVTVLPDYFVDRFVRIGSFESFVEQVRTKSAEGGGGSLRGYLQSEIKGGNAVNVAYALGRFGAEVHLMTIADSLAADTLGATFDRFQNVALDVIKGRPGFTVALEFEESGRGVNVMVSDPGDLRDFDGTAIQEKTWKKIATSKMVAFLNWGSMKKGTDACAKVFSYAKSHGAFTFLDPADVGEFADEIPSLAKRVLAPGLVDYLSLNENETRIISRRIGNYILPQDCSLDDLKKAARVICNATPCSLDIHTRTASLSCRGSDCVVVPSHRVVQKTITGAGDVWDAGVLLGRLLGWEPRLRLAFANASAGLYVSSESGDAPEVDAVLDFMATRDEFY